ncbi:MAG: hypothetical protein V2I24_01575, partial [Halieaceae bacterium]|nr:hypothetical protein [Halieaceae bacterium]
IWLEWRRSRTDYRLPDDCPTIPPECAPYACDAIAQLVDTRLFLFTSDTPDLAKYTSPIKFGALQFESFGSQGTNPIGDPPASLPSVGGQAGLLLSVGDGFTGGVFPDFCESYTYIYTRASGGGGFYISSRREEIDPVDVPTSFSLAAIMGPPAVNESPTPVSLPPAFDGDPALGSGSGGGRHIALTGTIKHEWQRPSTPGVNVAQQSVSIWLGLAIEGDGDVVGYVDPRGGSLHVASAPTELFRFTPDDGFLRSNWHFMTASFTVLDTPVELQEDPLNPGRVTVSSGTPRYYTGLPVQVGVALRYWSNADSEWKDIQGAATIYLSTSTGSYWLRGSNSSEPASEIRHAGAAVFEPDILSILSGGSYSIMGAETYIGPAPTPAALELAFRRNFAGYVTPESCPTDVVIPPAPDYVPPARPTDPTPERPPAGGLVSATDELTVSPAFPPDWPD